MFWVVVVQRRVESNLGRGRASQDTHILEAQQKIESKNFGWWWSQAEGNPETDVQATDKIQKCVGCSRTGEGVAW